MNNTKQYNEPLIKIRELKKYFPLKKTKLFQRHPLTVKANDGVDLVIHKGETLGLVGESGCGKSTLGRVIPQLYPKTSGDIIYYGYSLDELAPDYYFDDIKALPGLQKKYHDYKVKIADTKKKIELLTQQHLNDPNYQQKREKISLLQKQLDQVQETRKQNNALAFVTLNMNQLNSYLAGYEMINKNDEKLVHLHAQMVNLEKEYQEAKGKTNPDAEKEYRRLKELMKNANINDQGDIHKKIAVQERRIHKAEYDVELKIKALKADINVLVDQSENAKLRIVSGLNRLMDYQDINVKALYDDQKTFIDTQNELNQLRHDVEFGKEKDHIKQLEKKIQRVIKDVSRTVGGLLLVDDFQSLSQFLNQKFSINRDLKDANESIDILKNKLEILNKKLANENFNETQKDHIRLSIRSTEEDIVHYQKSIESHNQKLKKVDADIEALRQTVIDHPEYQDYEKLIEKGIDLSRLTSEETRRLRKDLQIIFQDPYSSLNPRLTVGQIIGEGLRAHGIGGDSEDNKERILDVMDKCGLAPYMLHRYPHQFSGGQRQRIGIARALAVNPTFVVCDEAVSALDVSIQSQIINLLEDLKEQQDLTYLFISHDLSVIKHISDRIGVMYLGKIVELTDKNALFAKPLHPYTKALISAIPTTENTKSEHIILKGDIPSNVFPPSGCKFRTRCPIATNKCSQVVPELKEVEPGHFVACHYHEKTKDIRPD